jgi:hypothetical protein
MVPLFSVVQEAIDLKAHPSSAPTSSVKHSIAKPKTIDEVLAQVEAEGGPEGRKAFEGFLRKMVRIKEERTEVID